METTSSLVSVVSVAIQIGSLLVMSILLCVMVKLVGFFKMFIKMQGNYIEKLEDEIVEMDEGEDDDDDLEPAGPDEDDRMIRRNDDEEEPPESTDLSNEGYRYEQEN